LRERDKWRTVEILLKALGVIGEFLLFYGLFLFAPLLEFKIMVVGAGFMVCSLTIYNIIYLPYRIIFE
jgi:hypothetical protein